MLLGSDKNISRYIKRWDMGSHICIVLFYNWRVLCISGCQWNSLNLPLKKACLRKNILAIIYLRENFVFKKTKKMFFTSREKYVSLQGKLWISLRLWVTLLHNEDNFFYVGQPCNENLVLPTLFKSSYNDY
jgi:hypothetical protein